MAIIKINDNPSRRELRQFAALWLPMFGVIVAVLLYTIAEAPRAAAAVSVTAGGIGAIGFLRPAFILPIYLIWMYAAYPIGFIVSHVLLGVIFFGLFTFIGVVLRLVGYDPLQRRVRAGETSYWTRIEPVKTNAQYFRQF
jgi:hypothetical protein